MDQEKEQGFTVTDKRSAFKDTSTQESKKPSPESSQQDKGQQQAQHAQSSENETVPPLPEANLINLLFSLYMHAQISLGILPNPMTQQVERDVQQAKYNIDLLTVLKDKTKGNLAPEEEQALESMLYELRMVYVGMNK